MNNLESDYIFNSALETGLRALCVLIVNPELEFDLQELTAFDYLVVHSGDFENGPSSLHPNVSSKTGELAIRRSLIERGLLLMEYKKLIKKVSRPEGFYFQPTDFASVFIESLTNKYIKKLVERAEWAVTNFNADNGRILDSVLESSLDNWSKEFQVSRSSLQLGLKE